MLNKNAFFLLGVSPRDNQETIADAFDEKASDGVHDEALLHQAHRTLMASKSRLAAEVSWFPDITPKLAKKISEKIEFNFNKSQADFFIGLLSELNGLSKANLAAYICSIKQGNIEFLNAIISSLSEVSPANIQACINANRKVSGFPEVNEDLG